MTAGAEWRALADAAGRSGDARQAAGTADHLRRRGAGGALRRDRGPGRPRRGAPGLAGARWRRGRRPPSSSSDGAPTCWWPTRDSTGWCVHLGAGLRRHRPAAPRRTTCRMAPVPSSGRAPRWPCRCWRRRVGRRGMERAVMGGRGAGLGRRRRADERRGPRLGHGVVPRPLQLGRPLQRCRRHRRRQPAGVRLPLLLGDGLPVGRRGGVGRHAGIGRGGTGGGDRHRQMAARASAGRVQRRLCLHQSRRRLGRAGSSRRPG